MNSVKIFSLRLNCCLFLVMFAFSMRAQTPAEDLASIDKFYSGAEGYSMKFLIGIYEKSDATIPLQQMDGEVCKGDGCYFSSVSGQINLVNRNCQIVVDQQQKLIYYDGRSTRKYPEPKGNTNFETMFDSLVTAEYTMQFIPAHGTGKTIEVVPVNKGSYFNRILISYSSTFVISSITYINNTDGEEGSIEKVTITYSNMEIGPKPPQEKFSEKQFVIESKNGLTPAPAYSGYKIIVVTEEVKIPQ